MSNEVENNNSNALRPLLTIITIIVFIVAEVGRLSSLGWGFFITPGFAALFLAASGCFITLKNKRKSDYWVYAINSILYLVWGFTWIDIPDYGGPSSLLVGMGVDPAIISTVNIPVMIVSFWLDVYQIVRSRTQERKRKDLGVPYDVNRNKMLGVVIGTICLSMAIGAVLSAVNSKLEILAFFAFLNAMFAWGGVSYANIKQKMRSDHWTFGVLCLAMVMFNIGFIELFLTKVLSAVNSIAVIGGMFTVMVTVAMLAVQRQREKYHDRY